MSAALPSEFASQRHHNLRAGIDAHRAASESRAIPNVKPVFATIRIAAAPWWDPDLRRRANTRPRFFRFRESATRRVESERLKGALLDRLTHHVHILEMNGDRYRLKTSHSIKNPGGE